MNKKYIYIQKIKKQLKAYNKQYSLCLYNTFTRTDYLYAIEKHLKTFKNSKQIK